MSQVFFNLLVLLDLEKIEEGLFCGQSEDLGLCQVFGGQVVGQVLYVVKEIVFVECLVYLFYSYFFCFGDSQKLIVYDVEVLCDGNSFSVCWVVVIQNGKLIFYMIVFFQVLENGYEYQKVMLVVFFFDGLFLEIDIVCKLVYFLLLQVKDKFFCDKLLEICLVEFYNLMKGYIVELVCQVWLCVNGVVFDDLCIYQYLLGYVLDFNFLLVVLQLYGVGFFEFGMQVVIIDYFMWFYWLFNINEWLFYSVESILVFSVCGFVCGEFYIQDGMLVVLMVQEGVMCNCNV